MHMAQHNKQHHQQTNSKTLSQQQSLFVELWGFVLKQERARIFLNEKYTSTFFLSSGDTSFILLEIVSHTSTCFSYSLISW